MAEEEKKDIGEPEANDTKIAEEKQLPKTEAESGAVTEEKKDTVEAPKESTEGAAKPEASETVEQAKKVVPESKFSAEKEELVERVIKINRVSKVVKGGKNFSFNALVVVGDANGHVGMGFGKSNEVVEAIKKGASKAKVSFVTVNMKGDTIPHEIIGKFKSAQVILKPAGPGTGVIAGSPVRALCDAAGIKNILTKSLGSRNAINVVKATIDGFEKLRLKRRGT